MYHFNLIKYFRMIHLTMIARVYDGLPLTASLQDDNLTDYQNKGNFTKYMLTIFKNNTY